MRQLRRLLSIALLSVSITALARADTVTFSESTLTPMQFCVSCAPYSLNVPQFDPSLGILQTISYSLTDVQTVGWGWNDITAPIGTSFQVDVIASTDITGLPIGNISTIIATSNMVTICQCSQISTSQGPGPITSFGTLTASGSFFDPSFIGTGSVPISFTDTPYTDTVPLFPVFSAAVRSRDDTTLDITYAYAPVPEPRQIWLVVALGVGVPIAARLRPAAKRTRRS